MLTTKTITNEQISKLRAEAYEAGDHLQGAICDLALDGEIDTDDYTTLEKDEARRVRDMSRDEAIAVCVETINAAQAMID